MDGIGGQKDLTLWSFLDQSKLQWEASEDLGMEIVMESGGFLPTVNNRLLCFYKKKWVTCPNVLQELNHPTTKITDPIYWWIVMMLSFRTMLEKYIS